MELSNHDESEAIVRTHVWCMSTFPDSLIARKRGIDAAEASRTLAEEAVNVSDESEYWRLVSDLDFWLRCDGHARNPGTTADLVGAAYWYRFWLAAADCSLLIIFGQTSFNLCEYF